MTFHQNNQFKFKINFQESNMLCVSFFEDMGEGVINYSVSIKVYRG